MRRQRSSSRLLVFVWCCIAGVTSALNCPENQFPYSCSTCLQIEVRTNSFEASREHCERDGGRLLSVGDDLQFQTLGRYLSGLNETRRLWIGYRFNGSGEQVGVTGEPVPDLVFVKGNFLDGVVVGDETSCIGVQEGMFVTAPCSTKLGFICSYTYEIPRLLRPAGGVVYAADGELVNLNVQFKGQGITGMEWRHRGSDATQSTVVSTSSLFTIPEFSAGSHVGRYEFVVANPAGQSILAIWELKQAVLGDITTQPQALSVPQGQVAAFECEAADARPNPTVSWFKNSSLVDVNSERFYVSQSTGTLFIRNLSDSDAGMYHCRVENGAGRLDSQPANLTLDDTVTQRVFLSPRNATVLVGGTYSLECGGTQRVYPSSLYTFLDQSYRMVTLGTYVYPQPGFPVYQVENVTPDHDANCFFCQFGPNAIGLGVISTYTNKAFLTVHSLPAVTWMSARVNGTDPFSNSSFQSFVPGSSIVLRCGFAGVPIPRMAVWSVDGKTIRVAPIEDGVSTLEIPEASESGVYQCRGANQYGSALAGMVLCESDGLPGRVLYNATPNSNTSLYVTWTAPSQPNTHPLLLRYEVITTRGDFNGTSGLLPAHMTEFIVSSLSAGFDYQVYVVAHSLVGEGEKGPLVGTYTFANAPDKAIPDDDIIVSRTVDDRALVIVWTYSSTLRNFVGYEVQYRGSNQTVVETDFLMESSHTILNLNNAREHEVRIRVVVQLQRGPKLLGHSPWTTWQEVQGIATLPTDPTADTPSTSPVGEGGGDEDDDFTGLLLVIVFAPVAAVVLVVVVIAIVVFSCWYRRRPVKSYRPARQERRTQSERQVPMGNSIFSLPLPPEVADQIERRPVNGCAFDSANGVLDDSGVSSTASPPVDCTSKDDLIMTSIHLDQQ